MISSMIEYTDQDVKKDFKKSQYLPQKRQQKKKIGHNNYQSTIESNQSSFHQNSSQEKLKNLISNNKNRIPNKQKSSVANMNKKEMSDSFRERKVKDNLDLIGQILQKSDFQKLKKVSYIEPNTDWMHSKSELKKYLPMLPLENINQLQDPKQNISVIFQSKEKSRNNDLVKKTKSTDTTLMYDEKQQQMIAQLQQKKLELEFQQNQAKVFYGLDLNSSLKQSLFDLNLKKNSKDALLEKLKNQQQLYSNFWYGQNQSFFNNTSMIKTIHSENKFDTHNRFSNFEKKTFNHKEISKTQQNFKSQYSTSEINIPVQSELDQSQIIIIDLKNIEENKLKSRNQIIQQIKSENVKQNQNNNQVNNTSTLMKNIPSHNMWTQGDHLKDNQKFQQIFKNQFNHQYYVKNVKRKNLKIELSKILGDGLNQQKILQAYQQEQNENKSENSHATLLCKNTQISNSQKSQPIQKLSKIEQIKQKLINHFKQKLRTKSSQHKQSRDQLQRNLTFKIQDLKDYHQNKTIYHINQNEFAKNKINQTTSTILKKKASIEQNLNQNQQNNKHDKSVQKFNNKNEDQDILGESGSEDEIERAQNQNINLLTSDMERSISLNFDQLQKTQKLPPLSNQIQTNSIQTIENTVNQNNDIQGYLNLKIDLKKNQKSFIVNNDLNFLGEKEVKNQYQSQKFEEAVKAQKKYLKELKSDQKLIGTFKNKYIRGLNQEDSVIADTETQRQALELSHTSQRNRLMAFALEEYEKQKNNLSVTDNNDKNLLLQENYYVPNENDILDQKKVEQNENEDLKKNQKKMNMITENNQIVIKLNHLNGMKIQKQLEVQGVQLKKNISQKLIQTTLDQNKDANTFYSLKDKQIKSQEDFYTLEKSKQRNKNENSEYDTGRITSDANLKVLKVQNFIQKTDVAKEKKDFSQNLNDLNQDNLNNEKNQKQESEDKLNVNLKQSQLNQIDEFQNKDNVLKISKNQENLKSAKMKYRSHNKVHSLKKLQNDNKTPHIENEKIYKSENRKKTLRPFSTKQEVTKIQVDSRKKSLQSNISRYSISRKFSTFYGQDKEIIEDYKHSQKQNLKSTKRQKSSINESYEQIEELVDENKNKMMNFKAITQQKSMKTSKIQSMSYENITEDHNGFKGDLWTQKVLSPAIETSVKNSQKAHALKKQSRFSPLERYHVHQYGKKVDQMKFEEKRSNYSKYFQDHKPKYINSRLGSGADEFGGKIILIQEKSLKN